MKTTTEKIKSMKGKEKIAVLTAYDYSAAKAMDECGVDIILIGDSLGMVVLGYENTLSVTMEDMMRHTGAVARGAKNALIAADMPANSYNDNEMAALNAEALIKSGADTIKIENEPEIAKFLVDNKIDVMGHIGLTPQTATNFKVQGKDKETADKLIRLAKELEKAGCYSIVLECVPVELAKKITESVSIPTIGIGAGPYCDGQVLVSNDMLGLYDRLSPKFVKKYADLGKVMKTAFDNYIKDVKKGKFPEDKQSFH
ncbi:3-methyl-2-oxobutanoate hydroxymethyltransferase [Candidatus Woesearchaeota archaeon]|nr:3-methyl-2-oxobutanoate hydroxymethyltransferase [Candidatus Woesearchaeota archaeon]